MSESDGDAASTSFITTMSEHMDIKSGSRDRSSKNMSSKDVELDAAPVELDAAPVELDAVPLAELDAAQAAEPSASPPAEPGLSILGPTMGRKLGAKPGSGPCGH